MNENGNNLAIPAAIVIAGALVAGALFYVNSDRGAAAPNNAATTENVPIPPVTQDDHILGSPNADIIIVEYSDTECPFCKNFHNSMHRIIDEFGRDGQVAWVYRHFPIAQLHSKAPKEAEATECAAELGGNEGFWAYIDRVFEVTPSNNGLDLARLPEIAEEVGLDRGAFSSCLDSGKYADDIQTAYDDAVTVARAAAEATGSNIGTPFSLMIVGDQNIPIFGAQPYPALRSAIESVLVQLDDPNSSNQVSPGL